MSTIHRHRLVDIVLDLVDLLAQVRFLLEVGRVALDQRRSGRLGRTRLRLGPYRVRGLGRGHVLAEEWIPRFHWRFGPAVFFLVLDSFKQIASQWLIEVVHFLRRKNSILKYYKIYGIQSWQK